MIGVKQNSESLQSMVPERRTREFRIGLVFSALFHVAVFAGSLVGIPALLDDPGDTPEIISVEFVTIEELAKVTEKQPEAETRQAGGQQEQKAAPEPRRQMADAVPPPDAKIIRKPEPKIQQKPRVIPTSAPRTKPRPPSKFNASQIAALIDKSIKEDTPPPQETEEKPEQKLADAVQRAQPNLLMARMATATISAAMRNKMRECWNVPTGAKNARNLKVTILLYLAPDGELSRPPQVEDRSRMNSDEFYRIAAESALRAVRRCAPYDLPKDMYDEWKQFRLNFDPSDMFG